MSRESHSSAGSSGWPRELLGRLPSGDTPAGARHLDEVAQAIGVERRTTTRARELRVDAVEALPGEEEEAGLWVLDVVLPATGRALRDWEGALLYRDLLEGGRPWSAEVVEADLRRGRLVVHCEAERPPEPGVVRAVPFDFLRAASTLVDSPRLAGARRAYARLLGACLGPAPPATGPVLAGTPARRGLRPPWHHPWALVWGPPGTGKTWTVVQALRQILQDPDERVLVLSTTNRATDEVALRLGPQPGGVLRVGSLRIGPFREAGLLALLPQPVSRLERVEAAQARLERARGTEDRARAARALARARRGLPRLRDLAADQGPRCVLATVHAALTAVVSEELDLFHLHDRAPFTTVILDEAGLVPRTTAAALGLLAARQLVLVGDPRQLSPICVASRSLAPSVKRWLAASAMEGADLGQPQTLALMQQHRMHPDISGVISGFQYDWRLQDAPAVAGRALPPALAGRLSRWPRAAWVVLDECEGESDVSVAAERATAPRGSWVRRAGLGLFGRLLDRHPELGRAEGLFISPYRGQAQAAGRLLTERGLSGSWSASTVHAQQGAEADVVVFDLVRHGGWPMDEWKRLVNVALSRARHQLLVLAARHELEGQPGCAALTGELQACTVSAQGVLALRSAPDAQVSLLGPRQSSVDVVEAGTEELGEDGSRGGGEARAQAPSGRSGASAAAGDPARLGTQIFQARAARRSMTREQAQLVHRDLRDLGPRLVRGVAGSGKTIVLARWAAVELYRHPDREAVVVFGNLALEGHLERLLEQAWRLASGDARAEPPRDRLHLVHVGTLLRDLLAEAGLPEPHGDARFDFEAQARALSAVLPELGPPRFGLLYLDEAQDLGHETLSLLVALTKPDPETLGQELPHRPVRVFFDNAQNLYGRSTPRWSELGLGMQGRSTVLRESFRATRQTMELALDLVHHLRPLEEDADLRELMAPGPGGRPPLLGRREDGGWEAGFCVVQGQEPEVVVHETRAEELAALVQRVRAWVEDEGVRPRDIRILASRKETCAAACAALHAAGLPAEHARSRGLDARDPRVLVTTVHSFKGYEAEVVAVVGLDAFVGRRGDGGARPLVESLYVALTRARTTLYVSGARERAGPVGERILEALARTRPGRAATSRGRPRQAARAIDEVPSAG